MKAKVSACKPKVEYRSLCMQFSEESIFASLRNKTRASMGIDPMDNYLYIMKDRTILKNVRGGLSGVSCKATPRSSA